MQVHHPHCIGVPGKESESVAVIWAPAPDEDQAVAPALNGVWLYGKGKRMFNSDRNPNIEPICFTSLFPRGTQGYALKKYKLNPNPVKTFTNEPSEYEEMEVRYGGGPLKKKERQEEWSSENQSDGLSSDEEFGGDYFLDALGISYSSVLLYL
jgi:hypothetical protein